MGILNNIKTKFIKQREENIEESTKKIEKIEKIEKCKIIFSNQNIYAIQCMDRKDSFIIIKNDYLPDEIDLDFIDMNKEQFDYYDRFFSFSTMMSKIIELEKIQENQNKTENDYLIEYMEKSNDIGYKKIIEQMKVFKMQKKQYNEIIDDVKEEIKDKISELYEKYKETNINLDTNRNYDEIKNDLIIATEFFKKYNYRFYREIEYKEGCISHCGYPDYMWQSGVERNIYKISFNS